MIGASHARVRFGPFEPDTARHRLLREDSELHLTPKHGDRLGFGTVGAIFRSPAAGLPTLSQSGARRNPSPNSG